MHAQPGVYAVLLGSGVSTGAGMPTGWGVVKELVRRLAVAEHPDDPASLAAAQADPEQWWRGNHGGDLGYSSLLEALAPTQAARQGLLASFFEPTDDDRAAGVKMPSKAHRSIAQLVKRGAVRVIITTNFDRLMEQALEGEGVSAQVIARPEAVNGMSPLAHAPATLIKLHGDYKDLGSLNTPDELAAYPTEWKVLVSQVLEEYGLVISGWSADWDTALVALLEAAKSRRYPLYWDQRSSRGSTAQSILANRNGSVITAADADSMFADLATSLDALERLAEPPLTTAIAVARLKRYLPDPVHRLDLHDLVMSATDAVVTGVNDQPLSIAGLDGEGFQAVLEDHRARSEQMLQLAVTGMWHDPEGHHDRLWMDVVKRLIDAGSIRALGVPVQQVLERARMYPALLLMTCAGVATVSRGRERLLVRLVSEVHGHMDVGVSLELPACQIAHPARVLNDDWTNDLPRWGGGKWTYPVSHLLAAECREVFRDLIPRDDDYTRTVHGFEYRMSLMYEVTNSSYRGAYRAMPGEFVGETGWSWDDRDIPIAEETFRARGDRVQDWPWVDLLGGHEKYDDALIQHRDILKKFKYHNMR
ncbi:SIR2 family protein [Nostocoides vanveenii]|uniref:SIR2-like domain-containing protein n=2 Tax=Nostocoides TaxID=99479 RepID=A0ABN2KET2_9MICO